MSIDISKLNWAPGFNPRNMKVVHDKGRTFIAAFDGTLSGRDLFNIREIYEEYGLWKPGKGVSVPLEHKASLLSSLANYADAFHETQSAS